VDTFSRYFHHVSIELGRLLRCLLFHPQGVRHCWCQPDCKLCFLFLIIILLVSSPLFAQDNQNTLLPLPELSELNYDNAELLYWQMPADTLFSQNKMCFDRAEYRFNWLPQSEQLTNRLILSSSQIAKTNYPALNAVFYQKLKQGAKPVNLYQGNLFYHNSKILKTLALGDFRLKAGAGLCLGSYQASQQNRNDMIYPASGLSHPALTGFAAKFNLFHTDIVGWLAQTERLANIENNRITSLYESSLSTLTNKDKVAEKTGGVIANFSLRKHNIGTYYYHQSLNYDWSDTLIANAEDVYGLFGTAVFKPVTFNFETFRVKELTAKAFSLEQQTGNFKQSFHYIYRPLTRNLSYSKTEQVFGQKIDCEELSWDLRYKQTAHLTWISRVAMVKNISAETDLHWKERLILSALWHNRDMTSGLTYYRFRTDAVPVLDTLAFDILPVQNRIKGTWKQKVASDLSYALTCQYQHYRDKKLSKNGIMLNQSLNYSISKCDVAISLLIWSNQTNRYQASELMEEDDYLTGSNTDSAFRIGVKYIICNQYRLAIQAYRPNHHSNNQAYNCSISANY